MMNYLRSTLSVVYLFAAAGLYAAPSYTVTDLGTDRGTIGNNYDRGNAINSLGKGTGFAATASGQHAALFGGATGPGSVDLGVLTGSTTSVGYALNDNSVVVGDSYSNSTSTFRPTLFSGTGVDSSNLDLGTLGGAMGTAYGINNNNKIVGQSTLATTDTFGNAITHATLFSGTGVNSSNFDLGTLGGSSSSATAININDKIVGVAALADGNSHAVLFSGTGINADNQDLGTLGGFSSKAYAINSLGQIVGLASKANNDIHAVLFGNTGLNSDNTDLGTLGGTYAAARAINSSGVIVGGSLIQGSTSVYNGFVYRNGVMSELNALIANTPGLTIGEAMGINDDGKIVAYAVWNQRSTSVLLTPIPVTPPVISPVTISYRIIVKASPTSGGTVRGGNTYATGSSVTITAKAKLHHVFINFTEGRKIVSRKKTYTFIATKARTLVAHFK